MSDQGAERGARSGPVVIVGAGPGGPGLLTVRGQQALAAAQVVVFDAGVSRAVLDAVPEPAERIAVGSEAGGIPQAAVPNLLTARVAAGLAVVRLVCGDAAVFGGEAEALRAAGVSFELVPGVSLAVAAVTHAGIPLRHPSVAAEAAIVDMSDSAHLDWRGAASRARTLVLPVAGASVSKVTEALTRGGWDPQTPVALISRAATTEQLTLTTSLGSLRAEARRNQSGDPVVLVVGEVVRLRSRLAWLERRPLFGRRIIVTRPRAQAARFAALLEAHGAEVVALPTIRLGPPEDWSPLDEAIARLGTFDWVMFTSANGVAAFHERLAHAERDARLLGRARLAAIGPETARALGAMGLRPDVVPAEYRAEGLAEALVPHVTRGSQVLLVRAAEAREALPEALRASGARVTIAPAYRTTAVKEGADFALAMLEARRVHVVTFTSSSTVRGFMGLIAPEERQRLLSGVVLAAIGPITAATLAEQGFEADVAPEEYTIPALTAAIAAHFEYRR